MAFIHNYGLVGSIIVLVLLLIIAIVKTKWFNKLANHATDRHIKKSMKDMDKKNISTYINMINDSDISNHDIFNRIDFLLYSKIPAIKYSTEYRTAIFRKYLSIYLKSHKTKIYEFVTNRDYQFMDNARLLKNLLNLINLIVYDYEREMKDANIPDIIIEKMKAKNNCNLSLTIDLVEVICNSNFYDSNKNFLKIYSILNIITSLLENTIINSEEVCNSINGQLKGFTYDGKVEP